MSNTLYKLTTEFMALLALGDSDDPEEQKAFMDTLEGLVGEIEVKTDSYAVVIAELKAQQEKVKTEVKRLTAIEKAIGNNIDRMKGRIKETMEAMGKTEIKTDLHTFKIQNNGGVQPLRITGEVPDNFKRVVLENDNDKIRDALKAGEDLPFAHLEERGTHLMIK